jgi:lipoic acid synthetase
MSEVVSGRKPAWLKVSIPAGEGCRSMGELLRRRGLHTVCEGARCPNRGECWASKTATFMVLGAVCTRGCRFCAVEAAQRGEPVNAAEPAELAEAVAELGLAYAVVTSVDRDDLADRGAGHFAACIRAIKERNPGVLVEVLIPDYGRGEIETVLDARPDVLAHNIETVSRLQVLRDRRASLGKSLATLSLAAADGRAVVKSSIMLGLGDTEAEVLEAMDSLRRSGCTSLVLGQYLRPTPVEVEVAEYVTPEAFARYARLAREKGFVSVVSAPLARTSYHARQGFEAIAGPAGPAATGHDGAPAAAGGASP